MKYFDPLRRRGAPQKMAVVGICAAFGMLMMPAPALAEDARRSDQWYFAPMQLKEAQELGKGGRGVVVAVLDTGVSSKHQDLQGALVGGWDIVSGSPGNGLDSGHGTGMAALIAGRGHGSGQGLLGVAPSAKIMPVAPNNDLTFTSRALRWAVDHGAKVVNMSFELEGEAMEEAVAYAVAADVVLVGAAGNDGKGVEAPARYPGVIAVGTVEEDNRLATWSARGEGVDLVTYGTQIPTAGGNENYLWTKGTSNSAALVSGAAALIRARYPDMSAAEVADRLMRTATDRGPKGFDNEYGAGQLDVVKALTAPRVPVSGPSTTAPTAAAPTAETPVPPAGAGDSAAYDDGEVGNAPFPFWMLIVGVLVIVGGITAAVTVTLTSRRGR